MLSGALLLGGFGVFWHYQRLFVANETGGAPVPVIAASVDIPLGQPVRAEWLTTKDLPHDYVDDRHLPASAMRDLIGLPLAQSVRRGEAILRTDLSELSDARRTLSGTIPEGERATTIVVKPTSNFGGLLRPGDRVDVLLTVGNRISNESWRQVVLLENVLVLAVGQEFEVRREDQGGSDQARTGRAANVTLQVTLEQGSTLAMARREGTLNLLLRNPNDSIVGTVHADLRAADIFEQERRVRFLRPHPRIAVSGLLEDAGASQ